MTEELERRRIWVLMFDRAGTSLLADRSGELPSYMIELQDGESTIAAVRRAVFPRLGVTGPFLDIRVDQARVQAAEDDGVLGTLVELSSPPDGWETPEDLVWHPSAGAVLTIDGNLSAHLERRVAEVNGLVAVDDLRAAWSHPGWYERAVAWIERVLVETGRAAPRDVVQIRHWALSALLRIDTEDGRCWFKASLPRFHAEAAVTDYLHHELPGAVASVIASETTEGWLLLDDFDGDTLSSESFPHALAIDHLVAIQKSFMGRADDLIAAGCEARQLNALPAAFTEAMTSPVAQEWLVVAPARLRQVSSWLDQAIASISELDVDDTLVHGDFHPGNVALSNGRPIVFDWSDASVGNPLLDIGAWATRFLDDPVGAEALWSMSFRAWSDVVPLAQLEALRPALQGVAHAFHAVSYAGILEGLESSRRIELADGLTNFFGRLDAAVPDA